MGGPEMAPHTPPHARGAPAKPWHPSILLARQRAHERFRALRRDQPRAVGATLDPHEAIGPRDVHPHDAALLGPQPAESASEPAGADAHGPADLLSQLALVEQTRRRDVVAWDLAAPQRPDDVEDARLHAESRRAEPEPDPDVDRDEERGRSQEQPVAEQRDRQEERRQHEQRQREEPDRDIHRRQAKGHSGIRPAQSSRKRSQTTIEVSSSRPPSRASVRPKKAVCAARHQASERSPSPSAAAKAASTAPNGTSLTSVVSMIATGVPSPSVTMLTSPASGNGAPSASNCTGRLAVARLCPARTSAASSLARAGESPKAKAVTRARWGGGSAGSRVRYDPGDAAAAPVNGGSR